TGRGHTGILFPGCPETFEESQQSGQQGYRGQQGTSQDQHQKVRRFREGDVIAIPAGVAHWCHNDGNEDVVTVTVHDTSSHLNQLDNNPRSFYLAGNPRDEFEQSQQSSQQKRFLSRRGFGQSQGSSSTCNNLFCGMDSRALAEAFNIDENLARKLQSENDNRGSIETFCSMRMRENIGDPSNADIFTPQAGRIRSLNSHNLPVLQWIQLSAERGVLYNEAIRLPHWNINAHSIVYAIRGQARVQIVNENGNSVFDGVTNDNAQVNTLAGRTSAIRAIPAEVLANAWRVSPEEARRLKFNRQETHLASTRSQSYRAEA
ncbi:11S globulin, partial [Linum grandiflorum]